MDHTKLRVMSSITVSFLRSNSCSLPIYSIYSSGNAVAVLVLTQESKSITFWKGCVFESFFFVFFFFFFFVVVVVVFVCFFFVFFLLLRFLLSFYVTSLI